MTDYELAWSLVIGWISLCIVVQLLSESRRGHSNSFRESQTRLSQTRLSQTRKFNRKKK